MSTANNNQNELYFEYKVLTRIIGESTFTKLHKLLCKLKANSTALPCTLRGRANGYVGMLVSAEKYATLAPAIPFVHPLMSGALVIDPNDTQYQIAISKTLYDAVIREHQTYVLMQQSLIFLVQQAIDNKYTNAARNHTGQLPSDVRLLLTHLIITRKSTKTIYRRNMAQQ